MKAETTIKVLLAEDDKSLGTVLTSYLKMHEMDVIWCENGKAAMESLTETSADICLLDVMMPEIDGFEVARKISKTHPSMPIVFITAKPLKEDVLKGYASGASDYIIKPFDTEILVYKIRALVKHAAQSGEVEELIKVGHMLLDTQRRTLTHKKQSIHLSPKEYRLLLLLCKHRNRLLDKATALQQIWGDDDYFNARSMDVYISKLRKYLSRDSAVDLITVRGEGYILEESSTSGS